MKCTVCEEDFELYDLCQQAACRKCRKLMVGNPREKAEFREKMTKKRDKLKEYRKQNLKYKTIAYKQAELIIEKIMVSFGFKVVRERILFPYIADFFIPEANCVIEIDGGIHDKQLGYDDRRDEWLKDKYSFIVIRYKNEDVGLKEFKESIWHLGEKFFNSKIKKINFVAEELGFPTYKIVRGI